jgi:hypothetical protein
MTSTEERTITSRHRRRLLPTSTPSQFGFDRYGVRVPAVLVSPLIRKGDDCLGAARPHLDHCHSARELRSRRPTDEPRSRRQLLYGSTRPCDRAHASAASRIGTPRQEPRCAARQASEGARRRALPRLEPISELQRAMVDATRRMTGAAPTPLRAGKPIVAVDSERAAGQYVELAIDAYLARQRSQASGRRTSGSRR